MQLDFKVIRVLMDQHGFESVAEFARAVGVHRNAMDRILAGTNDPSLATLGAMCRALKCTPNDILTFAGERDPNSVALNGEPKAALNLFGGLA